MAIRMGTILSMALLIPSIIGLFAQRARAQVTVTIAPEPRLRFLNSTGAPLAGGQLFTYQAGTTTPLATYTDAGGLSQNTNPIILDSTGSANVWLQQQAYKFVLEDSNNVQQWTVDNVSPSCAVGTTCVATNAINTFTSAQIFSANVTLNGSTNTIGAGGLLFGGNTSDPAGAAGAFNFRTDIGRFRMYVPAEGAWDSLIGLSTTDTLLNKTLTTPTLSGGLGGSLTANTTLARTWTFPDASGTLSLVSGQNCGTTTTCSATSLGAQIKIVTGTVTLASGSATVTGLSPAFTSATSAVCTASDTTTATDGAKAVLATASSLTITGNASDVVNYSCIGN
jgi:hypothetical protein